MGINKYIEDEDVQNIIKYLKFDVFESKLEKELLEYLVETNNFTSEKISSDLSLEHALLYMQMCNEGAKEAIENRNKKHLAGLN